MIHVLAHTYLPVTQTNLLQALQDPLILVLDSHFFIQDALNIICHTLWCIYGPKAFPNIIHEMIHYSAAGLAR